jgi:acyl-CoA synthetase (AMP-forming)/AMP-acid ligase II
VIISHTNVIANVLQIKTFESMYRNTLGANGNWTEVVLGLLPQSHIYGLVVISYTSLFRGDSVIVLPKFEMRCFLNTIQEFRINVLNLVSNNLFLLDPQLDMLHGAY